MPLSPALQDPLVLAAAAAIMGIGGFVKGATGFALPIVVVSGLASVMAPTEAVALLILPALFANTWQMLRQGLAAAWATARQFWRLNLIMAVLIALSAQVATRLPPDGLLLILGLVIGGTAALQLAGWQPPRPVTPRGRVQFEVAAALVGGVIGGLTGVWGPPVIFYLMAMRTEKTLQVRAQGISFFLGSVFLGLSYVQSGGLDRPMAGLSALMILPVLAGMAIGVRVQDRLDPRWFNRATLVLVLIAGLNLIRRALV